MPHKTELFENAEQQRYVGNYRRPGRAAILPPPKVVRRLCPLITPLLLLLPPIFVVITPPFCRPLLIAARAGPLPTPPSLRRH